MAEAMARDRVRDPVECTDRDSDLVVHMGKEMDMFQLKRDFNVSGWAYGQPGDRWCVLCLEVAEEPSLSRRSPALQSKMRVWPWASMALGGCDNVGDGGVFGNSGAAWISTRALKKRELFKFNSASRIGLRIS
ncbi:hypothetical protein Syun_006808 [Stephania yunnanensis]|uniref:Uncharacterized protein n=1 Tax=Stephania yunnanensis TaxID=152371 RepID=A0AAP0KX81_9MAGN